MEETSRFVLMFDKFFDIFNVSNFTNSLHQHKPFKAPFRTGDDFRLTVSVIFLYLVLLNHFLKWLEQEFLPYLDSWEASVSATSNYTAKQKKQMLLSTETLLGIRRSSNFN